MNTKTRWLLGLGIIVAVGLTEYAMGRVPWCTCGYIKLWHGVIFSSENSQHIFDWYSFTHIIHGIGFYALLWLADRKKRLSFSTKLLIALGLEGAWEILENSSFIIDRYRATAVSLNYYGDSIINSLSDIVAMAAGFYLAYRLPVKWSIGLVIIIELALAYFVRDNLTLNLIMLVHPFQPINNWQAIH
jgi:Protein of unknown function (DUF2585)